MKTSFVFIFKRRLQDVLIKTNIFTLLIRLQKMFLRRLKDVLSKANYSSWPYTFKTSSRCFQDIFKIFYKNVFKTSSGRLQDIFKTSSKLLQDALQKRLQDVFKTSCKNVFKTFSICIIRLNCLPRPHFWENYGQCRKFARLIKIYEVLA